MREEARAKARERAREQVREKVRERAREKAREKAREEEMEKRKKVKKKRAMTRRVAMILGASQPTLALGWQTSNCHVGQDWCGRLTSGSSWLLSSGTARYSSASSGRLPSEHWTET